MRKLRIMQPAKKPPPFEETMAFLRNAPPPGEYSRVETEKRRAARAFALAVQHAFKLPDEVPFVVRERVVKKKANPLERYVGKPCPYCALNMGPNGRYPTRDHVHPKSRGGKNSLENLLVVCRPCNSIKRNRTLEEFATHLTALGDKRAALIWGLIEHRARG